MVNPTCPSKKNSGGQREEGHGVVHHLQKEHHQRMKEGSHKKVQRIRMVQNSSPYLSVKKISGGQREEGHGVGCLKTSDSLLAFYLTTDCRSLGVRSPPLHGDSLDWGWPRDILIIFIVVVSCDKHWHHDLIISVSILCVAPCTHDGHHDDDPRTH